MAVYSSNGQFIDLAFEDIVELVSERIRLLRALGPEVISKLSPQERVELKLCDPVRFFVKNEPHSAEKVERKRFRLISSVSLIDSLTQRCVGGDQNDMEISK